MADPTIQLPERVPPLSTYYVYLTNGCNLACRHCWIAPTYEAGGGTGQCLDYDLYELAINEGLTLGLKSIKYTGGEPLLHPDFVRMVDYATKKGLITWMETNGTLITSALARHLKERTSLQTISVSLDGATAQSHDRMRNVPGSFERARLGILDLIEVGYKPQIIICLYPGNADEIEVLVRWAEKIGCGSVKFNLLQPSGRGVQMKERGEWLDVKQLIHYGQWVENELQGTVSIPLLYSWPLAFHGVNRLIQGQGQSCNLEHILGILSTGHLAMCGIGTQEKDLVYGQLGKETVWDVWVNNLTLGKIREILSAPLEGVCGSCIHQKMCKGSCLAQNYYSNKSLTSSFWFCQMAEQEGSFPLTRKCI